ncbi:hypothetical protein V8G54_031390 [Vigna mungo]|uniref:Uncharacterized protein n=1 Tax=Vigna mungo TaxID=3915 RepID=A0AAQ3MYS1_VIGMU
MELLLSSSSFSLSSASQPSTFSSEIHRVPSAQIRVRRPFLSFSPIIWLQFVRLGSFYQVATKSITPNGISVVLANPSLDSLSDLPDIIVQIVDLKPNGNKYMFLAEIMIQVYSKVSGEKTPETPTIDVSSKEFYGEGYDDSDKRIPDMTIRNKQLGWNPKTSLFDLLESTLTYQHRTYAEAIKKGWRFAILEKGVVAVENSKLWSGMLWEWNIPHNVLNASPKEFYKQMFFMMLNHIRAPLRHIKKVFVVLDIIAHRLPANDKRSLKMKKVEALKDVRPAPT